VLQLTAKNIGYIKIGFNTLFISFIIYPVLKRVVFLFPNDWLFFFTSDAVENLLCAIIVYTLFFKVFKLNNIWGKLALLLLFMIPLMALAILKCYRILHVFELERSFQYFTNFLGQSLLFYLLVFFFNRIELFNHYMRLETELKQAKDQLLKNQLHPHFLFNAFNSLYSMALSHNPKTPDTILKLSGMMRYLTDDSTSRKVKLTQDLKFIEEYISIEKIRFGEGANIQLKIEGSPEGKSITPLLLTTLVENAFKHGFYTNDTNAFVTIHLVIKNKKLVFKVENSIQDKQHFNKTEREGKGLDNLKKRLQLAYPKKHNLLLESKNNRYVAQLELTFE
jgi:hypothetical protein